MSNPTDTQNYKHYAAHSGKNMKEVHIMDKSLKGVLAQYGVQEVIENLLASFETVVLNPETDIAEQIQEGRMEAHNDVDFIAYLMECHPTDYELQTKQEWRYKQDKADFEAEADDIIIAKNL